MVLFKEFIYKLDPIIFTKGIRMRDKKFKKLYYISSNSFIPVLGQFFIIKR